MLFHVMTGSYHNTGPGGALLGDMVIAQLKYGRFHTADVCLTAIASDVTPNKGTLNPQFVILDAGYNPTYVHGWKIYLQLK